MKQNVNFIKHYINANAKLYEIDIFNSTHIALYNALFQLWNNCGFENELSINRNDVMKLSKIGSVNTYLKCLKELHKFGLIIYKPSHNPLKGSTINLFRFDTSTDTSTDTSSDTLSKQLNKENIYNEINLINKLLEENKDIKNEIQNLPKTLIIDNDYYNDFINKWNLYTEKYKQRKTKLTSLQIIDKQNLKTINKPISEISKALFILFNQDNIIESCLVTPKHFLNEFNKYYTAGLEYLETKKIIQFYKT